MPSITLQLFFRQHAIKIDLSVTDWAAEVKKGQNWRFRQKCFFFANNFWTNKASKVIWTPSCFSRRDASKYMHISGKIMSNSDIRSRSHEVTRWPRYTILRIGWCVSVKEIPWDQLHCSIKSCRQKTHFASYGLQWPEGELIGSTCIWVCSLVQPDLRSGQFSISNEISKRIARNFNFK